MKFIAHRGNIDGYNLEMENTPDYIDAAIDLGYDAEVDVWSTKGKMYLGHDEPQHRIPIDWLMHRASKIWIHTKNHEAFQILFRYQTLNVFWHQTDDFALTTRGYTWCYPGIGPLDRSVAVLPELNDQKLSGFYGICSDNISHFKGLYDKNTYSSIS